MVLFDINRINENARFFKDDPKPYLDRMLNNTELSYTLTLMTNEDESSRQVHILRKEAGNSKINTWKRETAWPRAMHSLSHIALPFPKTDPLYGKIRPGEKPGLHLGNIAIRGERGVIKIPASDMLRLRWNPFYSYFEQRIFDFVRL